MERITTNTLSEHVGSEVLVQGWVDVRRDQGKLIFLDIRDAYGEVQGVILPNAKEAHTVGETIRPEWVVAIQGNVNKRPEKNISEGKMNGDIELEILSIEVLNEAETPPFPLDTDGLEINEEVRMEYRYIDLRRERMQANIKNRSKGLKFVRDFFAGEGYIEIETPNLTKSTPEGARDYVVPSRLDAGKFYALPQSPQQYKQLLMSSGFEKYIQIARCYRDEDTRGDRQPEFTQIDMEASFVTQEDVMALNERMLIEMVKTLYPEKKIQETPFPRLSYKEVMEKYETDRPDLREDKDDANLLAFCWIVDFPFFEKTDKGDWTFTHNPFSAPVPHDEEKLMDEKDIENIIAAQYDIVLNGSEIGGGSIRAHRPNMLMKTLSIIGHSEEDIEKNFSHMMKALNSGTPPHGGIAYGFDRLMMILQNEENIREVIPFPKTGEGRDLLMDAPSEISSDQALELGISVIKPKKEEK